MEFDFSPRLGPALTQGFLGTCTSNAMASALAMLAGGPLPSRLELYWLERAIEGTTDCDAGASVVSAVKAAMQGARDESAWPYLPAQVLCAPPPLAGARTALRRADRIDASRVGEALAGGFPVIFGLELFPSFLPDADGVVPLPSDDEECRGDHCMLIVGYRDGHYLCRNSFGPGWGIRGHCLLPAGYVEDEDRCSQFYALIQADRTAP